ncbi:hypothetical protein PL10110_880006 [Planktothrix agardhii]|nr:hypothetical protein PL10110_880006 [Planktothrix agardhii]
MSSVNISKVSAFCPLVVDKTESFSIINGQPFELPAWDCH